MITDLIMKGSQALDDAEGFNIDRSRYMNASSATTCIRKQWFERNRPPVEQDWGYARRGKQGELYVVDALEASGATLSHTGGGQVSIISEEHRISATPDGYLYDGDEVIGLEIKTIDPRTNIKKLPKAAHVTQLQIAMEVARLQPSPFPHPDRGVLLYMDASNYNQMTEFPVPRDPGVLKRLAPAAKRMLTAKTPSKLDREGKRSGDCKLYGGCPFAAECGVEIEGDATVSRGNRGSGLDGAVRDYVMAKADEDEAKARKADAAESVKQGMIERNATHLVVGNHTVDLAQIAGRTTVDWKSAEAAGYDLSAFKKIGQASERLTIK